MARLELIALLGIGLIGGSLGMALVRAGYRVRGFDLDPEARKAALEAGAVSEVAETPGEAAGGADLVVLAAPPLALRSLLAEIAPVVSGTTIVSDVASVKVPVLRWAAELLPEGVSFIGGHPMAGKERSGVAAADPDLFRGATYCIVPPAGASRTAVDTLTELAAQTGARPLEIDAETHDRMVAGISHLPFSASAALVQTLAASPGWPAMGTLGAGGFRDTSRLAGGSPRMHHDISLANAPNIAEMLDRYIAELTRLRDLLLAHGDNLAADDAALMEYFARAQQLRQAWYEEYTTRTGGEQPNS